MKVFGVVYLVWNLVNGKKYVGQTVQPLEKRFNEHANCKKTLIGKAICKYGKKNFRYGIIKSCASKEEMDEWEKFFIATLKTKAPDGYNCTDGGEGGIHCDEVRAKMSLDRRKESPYKNLIAEMIKRQLSYKALAKLMEQCPTSISYKLISRYNFTDEDKLKLEKILGLPADYLLQIDEPITTLPKKMYRTPYKNLLDELNQRGFSYGNLAKILGVSVSSVSLKMRGKQNFTDKDKAKLVEIFGKPIEYLLQRDED